MEQTTVLEMLDGMKEEMEVLATHEEMKAEALRRMRKMDILGDAIADFKRTECVWASELSKTPFGVMPVTYFVRKGYTYYDEVKPVIDKIIDAGNLPFHAMVYWVDGSTWVSVLYVSKHKCEWGLDEEDMENNVHIALTKGWETEYGAIGYKPLVGGLIRTA